MFKGIRRSFRNGNKKKYEVTSPVVIDASKNQQEDKLKNIEFIKSDNPSQNENFIEAFIRFLMSSSMPMQDPRERLDYPGLASLTLISELFFNSELKVTFKNRDPIYLEVDIRNLKFQEHKISLDTLKGFVASEAVYSIKSIYFEKASTVRSLEWSNFRIEVNELVFFLIKLSNEALSEFLSGHFNKSEENKKEYDEIFNLVLTIKNNRMLTDYLFTTENKKYVDPLFEIIGSQPAICRENSEKVISGKGYRKSQVILADPKNKAGFYRSNIQIAEEPNNNGPSNLPSPFFSNQ